MTVTPLVSWPDVVAATATFLRVNLAPRWPDLAVAGTLPGTTIDAPAAPFVQVEVDGIDEDYPVLRDNLMRLTAYHVNRDLARDLAEDARGTVLALAYQHHATLRVPAGENGSGPLDAIDTVSDQPMCSVLVRILTRPTAA